MAITEANVEAAISALTAFSVQTSTEAGATPTATNTTASILHASASRTQGNFTIFLAMSEDTLTQDLLRIHKTATDAQKEKALAYLIADLQEKKDPDILQKSVSFDDYSVSRDGMTGSMKAYCAFLDGLPLVDSGVVDLEEGTHTKDHDDYPDAWRLTGIDTTASDPF
jgi:hypothetical protein